MALKKAGWTNAQIADDIGVETNSVAGAISRYRKKNEDGSRQLILCDTAQSEARRKRGEMNAECQNAE